VERDERALERVQLVTLTDVVLSGSAVVTALASVGAFRYVRDAAADAAFSRRALEGERHSRGLISRVKENERRSVENERVLRRADLRTDGGEEDG